jgi:hypothetical protein
MNTGSDGHWLKCLLTTLNFDSKIITNLEITILEE